MIGPLVHHLRDGADATALQDWIGQERIAHFGLAADTVADRRLAEAAARWWRTRPVLGSE